MNTQDKRRSAIGMSLPHRGMLPIPKGAFGAGDRIQLAYYYRGLADSLVSLWLEFTAPQRTPDFTAAKRVPDFKSDDRNTDFTPQLR